MTMCMPYVAPLCPAGRPGPSHLSRPVLRTPRMGGDHARHPCRLISPLAGEMSGRTEGGAKGRSRKLNEVAN